MFLLFNCVYKKIIIKSILFIDVIRIKVIVIRIKIVLIEMVFFYYNGLIDICIIVVVVVFN